MFSPERSGVCLLLLVWESGQCLRIKRISSFLQFLQPLPPLLNLFGTEITVSVCRLNDERKIGDGAPGITYQRPCYPPPIAIVDVARIRVDRVVTSWQHNLCEPIETALPTDLAARVGITAVDDPIRRLRIIR